MKKTIYLGDGVTAESAGEGHYRLRTNKPRGTVEVTCEQLELLARWVRAIETE